MPPTQQQPALPLLNPFLGWLPAKYWRRAKSYFAYEIAFTTTAAGAIAGTLTFDSDSEFLCLAQTRTIFALDATTPVPAAHFTVNIVDSSTGRALTNQPIHVDNAFGTAFQMKEGPLSYPRLIGPSTVWTITLTDLDNLSRLVRLAFHGFKIYPFAES